MSSATYGFRAVRAALCLASLAASANEVSNGPRSSRRQASANGAYSIQMTALGKDECRVEVSTDSQALWELLRCVGLPDDYYFVSNDAQRFWVVRTIPEKPRAGKRSKPSDVMRVVVAALYDRQGKTIKRMRLMDLMQQKSLGKVRQLGEHFEW